MGSTHSKQTNNNSNKKTTSGKLKSKPRSRKRSKLSGSFGKTNIKQQKKDLPSNHGCCSPPPSPSIPTTRQQEQVDDHLEKDPTPNNNDMNNSIDADNNQINVEITISKDDEDDEEDEILPLAPMRNMSTGDSNNQTNDRWNKRRTRNSSRSSRPISTISCSSDSGLLSGTSSGWNFSGGLFSHIDTNTSSTITAITDFSTISKGSVLDWPDDYNCHRKRKLPPPYCQQQTTLSTTGESSTLVMENSNSSNLKGSDGDLSCSLITPAPSPTTLLPLQDALLTRLAHSPMSSFRLFQEAFTTRPTTSSDNDSSSSPEEAIFKAAEIWYQQTNDTVAQVWMAQCTIEGWGTSMDPELGFTRLKALADHGCWEAYYPLANYYLKGIQSTCTRVTSTTTTTIGPITIQQVDYSAAYQWLLATVDLQQRPHCILQQDQQAVSDTISLAQYRLGTILFYGLGTTEQPDQAFHWFEKSATLGNRYSQFIVGLHYEKGTLVDQDIEKAKDYYLSSANQGFVESQAALGIYLVDQNQIEQGIHWLERAILSENTRALLKFGMMHEIGHGVSKDHEKAVHYYKMAVDQDDPVAHYVLGVHYLFGKTLLEQNHQQAGRHLTRSARAGFAPSQRIVGLMYAQGLLSLTTEGDHYQQQQQRRKDEKTALVWFRRAASHGDVRALGLVGYSYEYGHGAAVNFDIALQYYQKAARISSPFQCSAQVAVATLLHRMNRHHDALDWFLRASAYDSQPTLEDHDSVSMDGTTTSKEIDRSKRAATLMVARYRLHGWTGTKDSAAAFELLLQLTHDNSSDGHAHYWLAACYEEGIPGICNQDRGKAYHHYHIAAVAGDTDAQFQVAFMLSNGKGVDKNRSEAFHWYDKAAKNGHKTALYSLGLYYVKGLDGIPKDLQLAGDCFEKAAQLGLVTAMVSLASLYRMLINETLETRNDDPTLSYYREQILFWHRKAAALGDSNAQRELGIFYNAGLFGVAQDHTMALDWLSKASRQEDAQATLLLASYYQNGIVVDKNDDQALRLYLYASSLGSPVAHFAAAQLYHNLHQYENAYTQYRLASNHPQLQRTKIGRTSKLMVARYILSYVAGSPSVPQTDSPVMSMDHTKADAFKMLENLAVLDCFESSFYWLADCYFTGNGTTISYDDALHWYRRSADEINDKDSMYKVAQMYEKGLGSEINLSMALQYNQKSANLGHMEAQHQMGMSFWRGYYNLEMDLNKAVQWFTKSATQRYTESHWALGQLAIENDDPEMAVAWWQKAIDLGHVLSMRLLATLLLQQPPSTKGTPIASDIDRAVQLLADASRLGDTESLVLLGQVHQAGMVTSVLQANQKQQETSSSSANSSLHGGGASIVNSDGEEELVMNEEETQLLQRQQEEQELAIRCFERAACLGHVGAMFLAGQSWHTQQQYAAAFEFYNQAAQHGHTLARVMRARYRLAGLGGIPIQKEEGFKELLDCVETDECVEAYNSLGQCYEMGFGTKADAVCAYQWYLRSAEITTDAEAMYRIGQLYIENRLDAAETNIEAAFRWYKLADQTSGHVRANYQLGLYYLGIKSGQQSPHDSTMVVPLQQKILAMTHLQKAATQGDKDAMYELGCLYLSSDNDGLDSSSALECQMDGFNWLTRAAQQGSVQAQRELAMLYHSGQEVEGSDGMDVVVEQDFEKAYDLFYQAARQGDVTATIYIGTYYEHGIHVAPSTELAKEWYQDAIDQASTGIKNNSMLWLAELGLARLWHQEKASIKAYDMFCSAYQHGPTDQQQIDSSSSSAMAMCKILILRYQLYGWGGVTKNSAMAAQELLRMAEMGHSKVFLDVAQCYENGTGMILDHINAYTWYGRIVAFANSKSMDSTANINDDDDDDNYLWDEEDEQDHAMALYKLAEFYRLGYTPDGQTDRKKSISLYQLAADKGSEDARHYIQSVL
ncbi:hypothetical protein BC941DRAFT_439954 [Chlamydoabsidia padenii]|nr:hypothetical protein BC941DRAFT_439954 [Chlamydoabsidia padenii]